MVIIDDHPRGQQQEKDEEQGRNPFLAYAVEWLQGFGKAVPESIASVGKGFYDTLCTHNIVVDHAEKGRVVCTMRVPPRLSNSGHRLHGGAITSLVDVIGSAAIFSTGAIHSGVSVEINVTFMSEAPMDEDIEIESKVLRIGKNLAVVSVDLRRKATGQLVAQGRHTKFLPKPAIHSKL